MKASYQYEKKGDWKNGREGLHRVFTVGEDGKNWEEPLELRIVKVAEWDKRKRQYEDQYMIEGVFAVKGFRRLFSKTKTLYFTFYIPTFTYEEPMYGYFTTRPKSDMKYLLDDKDQLLKIYKTCHEDIVERPTIRSYETL